MDLILAIVILLLIGFIFYREMKSSTKVDLFMDSIPTLIVVLSAFFNFQSNKFAFNTASDWIYVASLVIAIAYTIYFIIKYQKNKKSISNSDKEEDNNIDNGKDN